jgi:hypothetical protein
LHRDEKKLGVSLENSCGFTSVFRNGVDAGGTNTDAAIVDSRRPM